LTEIFQRNAAILQQNIYQWLEEESYTFGVVCDPKRGVINIIISIDEYTGCSIILPKNNSQVLITTRISFSEKDMKTFAYLKKGKKLVFNRELGHSLLQTSVHFLIYPDPENLQYIQIRYTIPFDDLTKSNLLYGISEVIRATRLARLAYQKVLQIFPINRQYQNSFA
jgi:hypothetical protein